MDRPTLRHDWRLPEIEALYDLPLLELVFQAQAVHRQFHDPRAIQRCTLLSIKTGGCAEDCSYCPQSAHHDVRIDREALIDVTEVVAAARRAKETGSTRFCMGAAWRNPQRGEAFERVLSMVREVTGLGLEACMTLGMLSEEQAFALKDAGLTAYNHNLDTSRAFYDRIITTRTYDDRLETIQHLHKAGIDVCCGGIVGMGETRQDRCSLLQTLAAFEPHPESVPVNLLVPIEGTPLQDAPPLDPFELVRTVAVARLLMPASRVRLSAGRAGLSRETQALCFLAGANSIFFGERLLTAANPDVDADEALLRDLGLYSA